MRGSAVLELIGDGFHLSPSLVRSVVEMVGADNIVLMTDAMAATGMRDGSYVLGGQRVLVVNGVARRPDSGSLAGGTAHLIDVVRATTNPKTVSRSWGDRKRARQVSRSWMLSGWRVWCQRASSG